MFTPHTSDLAFQMAEQFLDRWKSIKLGSGFEAILGGVTFSFIEQLLPFLVDMKCAERIDYFGVRVLLSSL